MLHLEEKRAPHRTMRYHAEPCALVSHLVSLFHNHIIYYLHHSDHKSQILKSHTTVMVALGKASNAFLAWTASQGIETPLNLAERADGRYTICSEDIQAGQDLLSCPLSACIVADTLEGEEVRNIVKS